MKQLCKPEGLDDAPDVNCRDCKKLGTLFALGDVPRLPQEKRTLRGF